MSAIPKPSESYTQADIDLEIAHQAMTRYAVALGDSADCAAVWAICHAIKDRRRPEVVEAMEAERMERICR